MSRITLAEDLEVYYQGMFGKIGFVCEHYVTICVRTFPDKSRNVSLIVYPEHYKEITLAKESTK